MKFTGERYVPGEQGRIRFEHLHRYALALEFASGKAVIDMASGEGYGAELLAAVAKSVTGVDIDPDSVAHSRRSYFNPKLSFVVGSCSAVPLPDECADVITSFETIEHHDQHDEMMSEIKRLLKPGGTLIISSPNRRTYSDEPGYKNPFHVKELYFDEFYALLAKHFSHIRMFGQRLAAGSFVYPLNDADRLHTYAAMTGSGDEVMPAVYSLPSPIYFVAICSDDSAIEQYESASVYLDKADDLFRRLEEERVSDIRALQAQIERSEAQCRELHRLCENSRQELAQQAQAFGAELSKVIKNTQSQLARQSEETRKLQARLMNELAEARAASTARMDRLQTGMQKLLAAAGSELDHRARMTNGLYNSRAWRVASRVQQVEEVSQRLKRLETKLRKTVSAGGGSEVFHGYLDSPGPGENIGESIELRGWVFSQAAPVSLVQVFLDNFYLGDLHYGAERSDVITAYAGAPANCGFTGRLSLGGLRLDGGKILKLRIHDQAGNRWIYTQQVVIGRESNGPAFAGSLDYPRAGGVVTDVLEIAGWAHSPAAPIALVEAFLDDLCLGALSYPVARADVARVFPEITPLCGFADRISLVGLNVAGERLLTVRIYDEKRNERVFKHHIHVLWSQAQAVAQEGGAVIDESTLEHLPPQQLERAVAELAEVIAEFQEQQGRDPSILDCSSGLDVSHSFPALAVSSPPQRTDLDRLPYLDQTFDIVVVPLAARDLEAEARRVAASAVVWTPDLLQQGENAKVQWLAAAVDRKSWDTSIVIPVFNKVHYTKNCLQQLAKTLPHDFDGEIIVVDDASTDETAKLVEEWSARDPRIKLLRNAANSGFIASCNRGAEQATGQVLVFLNNDTLPLAGWLPPLLRTLREKPEAGAVGGKLIYPSGVLQEAGGVIFSDGSGCNFGKNDAAADAPLYSFFREVDYCSGALLATPRSLFLEMGGFDSTFSPAYYEDSDYCFRLRQKGRRVYYQPESVIIHFEGVSSGTDITTGVKSYQAVNRVKFVERWAEALKRQPAPPERYDFASLSRLAVRGATRTEDGK